MEEKISPNVVERVNATDYISEIWYHLALRTNAKRKTVLTALDIE